MVWAVWHKEVGKSRKIGPLACQASLPWRADAPLADAFVVVNLPRPIAPKGWRQVRNQERTRHINLREQGHPAGQTGVYRPVSQKFPVVYYRRTTIFAGTPAGCPRDTRTSRGFSENLCDFFLCAFFAP